MEADAIIAEYTKELTAWFHTRSKFNYKAPHESVIEFQHALNHLCMAAIKTSDNPERVLHIQKATGHIHRAHLDLLKVHLLDWHKKLAAEGKSLIKLTSAQCPLRLDELASLGKNERTAIFEKYQNLLAEIISKNTQLKAKESESPPADQSDNNIKDLSGCKTLYLKWAKVEAMIAALRGERSYDNLAIVVESFENGTCEKILPQQTGMLKFAFIGNLYNIYKNEPAFSEFTKFITEDADMLQCQALKEKIITYGKIIKQLRKLRPDSIDEPAISTFYKDEEQQKQGMKQKHDTLKMALYERIKSPFNKVIKKYIPEVLNVKFN